MALPPFNVAETIPGDTDIISQHPSGARTFRDVIESWISFEHDTSGHHKILTGTVVARDAITDWVVGSLWINTDDTPDTLQFVTSVGPVVWVTIGPVQTDGITATELATDAVTTVKIQDTAVTLAKLAVGTEGSILVYGPGGGPTLLGQDTAGKVLTTNGPGATASWEAVLTEGTNHVVDPIAKATSATAHGLASRPAIVSAFLECKSAEFGFVAGDRIYLGSLRQDVVTGGGIQYTEDSTNCGFIIGVNIGILREDTQAPTIITFANWKGVIRPFGVG